MCVVGFFLLWSDSTDKLTIGDILYSVLGNVFFADEADGVGAFYPAANAVCESSKFIG